LTVKKWLCKVKRNRSHLGLKHGGRILTLEEETMNIHRGALVVATVAALVGGPLFGGLALAGNKHVDEAIEHAKEAVSHGKQGHADALVKHAEGALMHAQGAQKDMKNPHLDEGVKQLTEAVAHGKAGHADVATTHAEGAVTHLSEVK
jgi:Small metal-binding protein